MNFDLYTWIYLITNCFSMMIVYKFVTAFFAERITKPLVCFASYLSYFICTSFVYIIWDIPVLTMSVNVVTIFVATINYKSSLKKKLVAVAYIYVFMLIPELLVSAITNYFNFPMFDSGYYNNITGLIIVRILTYLEALIFYNVKSIKRHQTVGGIQWIATIFIPVSTLFIKIFLIDSKTSTKSDIIVSTIIIFLINLLTFYLYDSLSASYIQKTKATVLAKEREMYYNQCVMMQETAENLQRFKHDINNQFISIKELVSSEKYDELKKIISGLSEQLDIKKMYSTTGNIAVDSIINYKLNSITESNVEITTEIAVPETLEVEINDMVSLIGNILDNAIYALKEVGTPKKLYFKLAYNRGRILIKETNNYKTEIQYVNGEIVSAKDNSGEHGFGLKNIEKIVNKYNGYSEINHSSNIFTMNILMFVNI